MRQIFFPAALLLFLTAASACNHPNHDLIESAPLISHGFKDVFGRQVVLHHVPNRVHMLVSKGGQGRAKVTTQDLIEACLRLRPDRLMLGELRGKEAFSFMRAVNTGHPGSISTLHADTPALAIEQLILMIMQADLGITREQIKEYVESVIQVIIQLKRGEKGRRFGGALRAFRTRQLARLGGREFCQRFAPWTGDEQSQKWCDRGEWEVLVGLGLHTMIDRLFSSDWQSRMREREFTTRERLALIDKLGPDLAQQIFDLSEQLENHPNGDFGVAYLMRRLDK